MSQGFLKAQAGAENKLECFLDGANATVIETVAAQADDIDGAQAADPVVDAERGDIFAGAGAAAHHGEVADAHELMHLAVAGRRSPRRPLRHGRPAAPRSPG